MKMKQQLRRSESSWIYQKHTRANVCVCVLFVSVCVFYIAESPLQDY